jgi:hypothetical protein
MTITLDGTTGITTPAETVQGALTTTGNTILGDATTDTLTVGVTGIVKDASGNVGIGTALPASQLHQYLASGTTYRQIQNGTVNITEYASTAVSACAYGTTTNHSLLFTTNNTNQATITAAGLFQFNSGYGSVATAYGCRAWINFNGTGTVAIRGSGNVSSITDNGTGDYSINFTTAIVDTNYAVIQGAANNGGNDGNAIVRWQTFTQTTALFRFQVNGVSTSFSPADASNIHAAIFR